MWTEVGRTPFLIFEKYVHDDGTCLECMAEQEAAKEMLRGAPAVYIEAKLKGVTCRQHAGVRSRDYEFVPKPIAKFVPCRPEERHVATGKELGLFLMQPHQEEKTVQNAITWWRNDKFAQMLAKVSAELAEKPQQPQQPKRRQRQRARARIFYDFSESDSDY